MKASSTLEADEPSAAITAYALGELPPDESAALEARVHDDPALAAAIAETKEFCGLLTENLQRPTLELQCAARARILLEAGRPQRDAAVRRRRILRRFCSMAACLALGGGATWTWLAATGRLERNRFRGQTVAKLNAPSEPDSFAMAEAGRVDSLSAAPASLATEPGPGSKYEVMLASAASLPSDAYGTGLTSDGTVATDGLARHRGDERRYYFRYIPPDERTTPGSESYKAVPENVFREVLREPLSTFSVDVDTASYANVRRFLNLGQAPPPEAVRLEELVNYFPYDYAPPVDGRPFAVHIEMASAPWNESHRLARVALKGKEIAAGERPPANLVFLIDVSGSMQPFNKLPLIKQSLRFVVASLTERDTVSIVTYAGESGVALPATNGAERQKIQAAIDALGAGGSTNGAGGIETAYEQAAKHFRREGINRVVLATDGDFNVGVTSHESLVDLITAKAKTGVFLSVLGFGYGNTKDDTMELLADKGNGNYAYIDSLSEARKVLAEQSNGTLVTIAKDVKIQIEFNPAVVRSYRLLGYENRLLAKEDFNNDQKDAGEIGAGHTVTALYELVPVGAPATPAIVDDLKYQRNPARVNMVFPGAAVPDKDGLEPAPALAPGAPSAPSAPSDETMTVKLRWKAPDADKSELLEVPVRDSGVPMAKASAETRWAAAVAGFASLLNNSSHPGLSWAAVRELAKGAKGADPHGYRGEFLQLLDKAEAAAARK